MIRRKGKHIRVAGLQVIQKAIIPRNKFDLDKGVFVFEFLGQGEIVLFVPLVNCKPQRNRLNRRLIRTAHENNKEVYVWTVNDAPTMSAMISRGVDGLLTDKPALAQSVLEQPAEMSVPERLLLELAGTLGAVPDRGEQ